MKEAASKLEKLQDALSRANEVEKDWLKVQIYQLELEIERIKGNNVC